MVEKKSLMNYSRKFISKKKSQEVEGDPENGHVKVLTLVTLKKWKLN